MATTTPPLARIEAPLRRAAAHVASLNEITPEMLRRARVAAQRGEPARFCDVLDFFMDQDEEIPTAMESLISASVQNTTTVAPTEEHDEALYQAEVVRHMLKHLRHVGLLEEALLSHLYPAKPVHVEWNAWSYEGGTYQAPVTWDALPDWWVYADTPAGEAYPVVYVGRQPHAAYDTGTVLLFTAGDLPKRSPVLNFCRLGKGLAVVRFGVYAWFSWEDWAAYNEVLGIPSVVGTLLDGYGDEDEQLLRQAVFGITSDSRAMISERTKLEFLKREVGGQALFKDFGEALAQCRTKIIKGESLTSGAGRFGTYGTSVTANGIRQDVAQRVVNRHVAHVQRELIEPFCRLNFGRCFVELQARVRAARSLTEELAIDAGLAKLGVELSKAELRERYGRRAPHDDEDAVTGGDAFPFLGG